MNINKFKEITSTNDYMKEQKNIMEWDTVCAEHQTKGRGRNGKKWVSDEGGAWFTTIIKERNTIPMSQYMKLPLVIGIAIAKILEKLGIEGIKIKWPNDIYVFDKKICGILVEKSSDNFIVGIGINVNMKKMEEVEKIATSIYIESGKSYEIEQIIYECIENIKKYYEIFTRGGWSGIVSEIMKYDYLKGKEVEIISSEGVEHGKIKRINENGEIEAEINGRLKLYCSGEISIKI